MSDPNQEQRADPEQHRVPDVDDSVARETPSQAEGDRDTIEADLAQKLDGQTIAEGQGRPHYSTGAGGQGDIVTTPSQAEGNRGEIDEDMDEKGRG